MIFEDSIQIDVSAERVFAFFQNMDRNYLAWHPDHTAFRWVKSASLAPGVIFYFEEIIGGDLLKKTVRFTQVIPNRTIEFAPTFC